MEKYKRGQTVYCQGIWKCKVVKDYGISIDYIPLEGDNKKIHSALKNIFKKLKDK